MTYLRIIIFSATVLFGAGLANADPLRLDYQSTVSSCPDSDRFADQVSSQLGFVPWRGDASEMLRIRIRQEGPELVGSMELPDGSSKILRDTTCPRLFDALASAASVALDTQSAAAPVAVPPPSSPVAPPPPPVARSSGKSTVHVRSDESGIIISTIAGRAMAAGANGQTAAIVSWDEKCVAPCSFEVEPGIQEIVMGGNGPAASNKLSIAAGEEVYLVAKPGSSFLKGSGYLFFLIGGTTAILGGLGHLEDDTSDLAKQALWGGLAGAGLGIGMMYWARSELTEETRPSGVQPVARTISYSGKF